MLSNKQRRYIDGAINAACLSKMGYKVGAIVVKGAKIVSIGCNNVRETIKNQYMPSCHAEIDALYKYLRYNEDVNKKIDVWVVRVCSGTGVLEIKNSRPCATCVNTLKKYGVRKVWYYYNDKLCCENVKDMSYTYLTRFAMEHCKECMTFNLK